MTKVNASEIVFVLVYLFLDYNDYLTNYSSSEVGNKDKIGKSRINSPYAWCINARVTKFNVTLNQLSYITGISCQGDSNTGKFIQKFKVKYLRNESWRLPIPGVWYFLIFLIINRNFQLFLDMICLECFRNFETLN